MLPRARRSAPVVHIQPCTSAHEVTGNAAFIRPQYPLKMTGTHIDNFSVKVNFSYILTLITQTCLHKSKQVN